MYKYFIIVLTMALSSCQTKTESNKEDPLNNALTNQLQEIYNRGNLQGFSVSLVNPTENIYQNSFGYADIKKEETYSLKTKQPIASISKTLVGISLLKAQELGKLNLDDPINKYLSTPIINPHFPETEITLRQLANHTSTILDTDFYDESSYFLKQSDHSTASTPIKIFDYFNPPNPEMSLDAFVKKIIYTDEKQCCRNIFLNEKPRTTYKYSNIATDLAALIIELATDMPFDKFTEKYILNSLKMKSSSWDTDDTNTKLYHDADTVYADYYSPSYPCGGFVTHTIDISKYLKELIKGYSGNGTILSQKSYSELFAQPFTEDFYFKPFPSDGNLFLNIRYDKGIFMGIAPKGFIGHTGSDPGTTTFMFFNYRTEKGFILLINRSIWQESEDALNDLWDILSILESNIL